MFWNTGRKRSGGTEVAGRPEDAFPVALADVGVLLAQQATGNSLETIYERATATLGVVFHKQMHVVIFAVHLHQRSLRVRADVGKDAAQDVKRMRVEHTVSILFCEVPMRMQFEQSMSAMF